MFRKFSLRCLACFMVFFCFFFFDKMVWPSCVNYKLSAMHYIYRFTWSDTSYVFFLLAHFFNLKLRYGLQILLVYVLRSEFYFAGVYIYIMLTKFFFYFGRLSRVLYDHWFTHCLFVFISFMGQFRILKWQTWREGGKKTKNRSKSQI